MLHTLIATPTTNDATAKFQRVQEAYERIVAGRAVSDAPAGITVSMEIQGGGPTASFLTANTKGVVVGSSQGRLYTKFGSPTVRTIASTRKESR